MYTVLMVEDETICPGIGTVFSQECALITVPDLSALLHRLQTAPADLVILDLDLPGSRKADLTGVIKVLTAKSVFLFTADQNLFDPSHPLTAVPAMDYLLRPYTEEELILTLETAFYLCEKRKQAENTVPEEPMRLGYVRDQIEDYIWMHYGEDLSMQGLAQVMNYSETHFCRLFKQCFKVNFSVYLNKFRIEQAKRMLLTTNQNVKEVAQRCGYQDNSYFIRVFKRFTGMTPMDYRISMQPITRK